MMINDQHTPDHEMLDIGQPGFPHMICATCEHLHRMAEIEEALELGVREGAIAPHVANAMTDDEKEAWFARGMTTEPNKEEPF